VQTVRGAGYRVVDDGGAGVPIPDDVTAKV
jgi:hypothetical protein